MNSRYMTRRVGQENGADSVPRLRRIPPAAPARPTSRRRGMVLIVVIICLALAGSLLVMISHSLTQQATTVRHERAELTLRQIIDSGRAWAGLHPEALTDTAGVSLDASSLAPADAVATVLLTLEPVQEPR